MLRRFYRILQNGTIFFSLILVAKKFYLPILSGFSILLVPNLEMHSIGGVCMFFFLSSLLSDKSKCLPHLIFAQSQMNMQNGVIHKVMKRCIYIKANRFSK